MQRIASSLLSVCCALFCTFGLLASFEPGNHRMWTIVYGVFLGLFLMAAILPWISWRQR